MIATLFPGCELQDVLIVAALFLVVSTGVTALLMVLAVLVSEWHDDNFPEEDDDGED